MNTEQTIELTEIEIERFKEEREKHVNNARTEGFNAGVEWAKYKARYGELINLHRQIVSDEGCRTPETMKEFFHLVDSESGDSDWADWLLNADLAFIEDEDFADAFVGGALKAFEQLQEAA